MRGLVALRLSDESILPFHYNNYATELDLSLGAPRQIIDSPISDFPYFLFFGKSKFIESRQLSWLSEWSIGYLKEYWECLCELVTLTQVNQRVQKGSCKSGFWIEGIYSPDCCMLLPDPCFQLCLTFLPFFLLGSTDMENLVPMEKQPLKGQRHQWSVDDDRTGIHRPGRTVWTAMVQTPGTFLRWVLRKSCHHLMLPPNSRKRNHTDLRTFAAQRLRGWSVSRHWWRHWEGEENKYFWILAIYTTWDLQGLSSHKPGSACFKWRAHVSIISPCYSWSSWMQ